MSNRIIAFCSVVTTLTAFSVINISSAVALPPTPTSTVSGEGKSFVGAAPTGTNRLFVGSASSDGTSKNAVNTNAKVTATSQPLTASTVAESSAQAGQLAGRGDSNSQLSANGTGPTNLKITAEDSSQARISGTNKGVVISGSGASLDSRTGGAAAGNFTFSSTPLVK
jgi:hypothetical protein